MAHNYIIQWNCRGLRINREDIELLVSKYSPAAICLQKTLLTPHQTQTFRNYSAYYKSGIHGHGGVCILVKNKFIHSQVQLPADLQAVCITINNITYTVPSVYVPPSEAIDELAFDRKINSFSSCYLILGDFNGHSHLWEANQENEHGKVVEKLIDRHNLILLNDSVHNLFETYHQTSSLLNLSLCHPSINMDVAFEVYSDRLGSDHHPIIITANTSNHPVPKRVKKAKWDAFQDQCITEITPDIFNDAEDKMAIFSNTAIEKSSSSENYSKGFQSIKAQKEKHKINFKTNRNLRYIKKFAMRDLKRSLKSPIIHLQAQIDPFWNFTPPSNRDSP